MAASHHASRKPLLLGVIGGLALIAGVSLARGKLKSRRYSDHDQDRRKPMNQFAAGVFPGRRTIDSSGQRPLFERRQSAYETY